MTDMPERIYVVLEADHIRDGRMWWREKTRPHEVACIRSDLVAAKDAEIAELRARLAECEEAVDQAVALAEYLEGHSKGAMAERVKTALSAKFAQERRHELANLTRRSMLLAATEHERNEARECVRRLWPLVNEHADCLRAEADAALLERKRKGFLSELANVESALAATPEHLRK